MLEIREAVFGYGGKGRKKIVLEGISFSLAPGELLCILGANGAGKTTMYLPSWAFSPFWEGRFWQMGKISGRFPERNWRG